MGSGNMSQCGASSLYDHLDHCVIVSKDIQHSFFTTRIRDEFYALLQKVWNELERHGFFMKTKSRVTKHDDQSKEHHNEGANLDRSCRSERFIVEKCPMRYESIGSREFDEHSESEFLVSTIEALRKNLAPKCNVKRNGGFDPC